MAYHAILSKLDRAVVAYLIASGVGKPGDTLPAKNSGEKPLPVTIVHSQSYVPDPLIIGNFKVTTMISCKYPASIQPDETDDPGQRKSAADDRSAKVFDSLYLSDDGATLKATAAAITSQGRALATGDDAANNADMADFTVLNLIDAGGLADFDDEGIWTDQLNLTISCCPSNVD